MEKKIKALTFDLFGTILDLEGSLSPYISDFIGESKIKVTADSFWDIYRHRQRIEQYQDNILMLGHSGYTKTAENAFIYTSNFFGFNPSCSQIANLMKGWKNLTPFKDVLAPLEKLSKDFKIIALSNGELEYLTFLAKERIKFDFDEIISVESVGEFKPAPSVYRKASEILEIPLNELLMVSSNSFDVLGAVSCGLLGAYVNRYSLPYENSPHKPDIICKDFIELENKLNNL